MLVDELRVDIKLRVGLAIHIICEVTSNSLIYVFCVSLILSETSSVCAASHCICVACGNDLKIENTSENVTFCHGVTCEQASFSSYLHKTNSTEVFSRSRLSRLLSFAEIYRNAPAIQISSLHFIACPDSILNTFVFGKSIAS